VPLVHPTRLQPLPPAEIPKPIQGRRVNGNSNGKQLGTEPGAAVGVAVLVSGVNWKPNNRDNHDEGAYGKEAVQLGLAAPRDPQHGEDGNWKDEKHHVSHDVENAEREQ